MADLIAFPAGGYRYLAGVFQYSAGVAADTGFEIEHARLVRALPLADGFAAVEGHLAALGRPTTAFCACELRSPAPLTDAGFTEFNRGYVTTLERWGIYREGRNPVARSNVCPEVDAPAVASLYTEGLREKARWVLGETERRMAALGFNWATATATQLYTVYDIHPFFAEELVKRGATPAGLTWHFARPPVQELDYEMDVRAAAREILL